MRTWPGARDSAVVVPLAQRRPVRQSGRTTSKAALAAASHMGRRCETSQAAVPLTIVCRTTAEPVTGPP